MRVHLRDRGLRHDLISAVFEKGDEDDLVWLVARVEALDELLRSNDGENLLTAYRRAANILRIEEKKDGRRYEGEPEASLFNNPQEIVLGRCLNDARELLPHHIDTEIGEAMTALAGLRRPIDQLLRWGQGQRPGPRPARKPPVAAVQHPRGDGQRCRFFPDRGLMIDPVRRLMTRRAAARR